MRRLGLLVAVLTLTGCAIITGESRSSRVDLSGRWIGKWIGYGILDIPREETATADLTQKGRHGDGVLSLDNTAAAEAVPLAIRRAGLTGSRVRFDISGSDVVMTHELGGQLFTAEFVVKGDRMVGYFRYTDPAVRLVLVRARPEPPAPAPRAAVPQPPPPPPAPVAPEPSKQPEVAVAPPPPAPAPEPAAPEPAPSESTPAEPAASEPAGRPAPREFARVPELKPVYFDFNRADIRQSDVSILDASAQYLKENPDLLIMIEGHCDERGTNEYNLALGERRAKSPRDYLVSRGVAADRITTVTYGEERPICTEKNETCWRINRRTEFLVRPQ